MPQAPGSISMLWVCPKMVGLHPGVVNQLTSVNFYTASDPHDLFTMIPGRLQTEQESHTFRATPHTVPSRDQSRPTHRNSRIFLKQIPRGLPSGSQSWQSKIHHFYDSIWVMFPLKVPRKFAIATFYRRAITRGYYTSCPRNIPIGPSIWRFPKMGVPPNRQFFAWVFHY